jgi:hypothetical protein
LSGDDLDFKHVAKLLESDHSLVANAAGDYLSECGNEEARRLWYAWNSRESSGPLMAWDPEHGRFGWADELVLELLKRNVIKDHPKEIISLQREVNGGCRAQWQVMVFQDHALAVRDFRYQRIGVCRLPDGQVARIQHYITTYQTDDLPDLKQPRICDGESFYYFHATSKGVAGLYMENPFIGSSEKWGGIVPGDDDYVSDGMAIYPQLVNVMKQAFTPLNLKLSYGKDAEILIPRETAYVKTVWKQGDDLRVLVGEREESWRWMAVDPKTGELKGPAEEPAGRAGYGTGADTFRRAVNTQDPDGILAGRVEKILKIEHLRISPWMDEAEGVAYVAIEGDLLKVATPPDKKNHDPRAAMNPVHSHLPDPKLFVTRFRLVHFFNHPSCVSTYGFAKAE